jgi:hypothetical protein
MKFSGGPQMPSAALRANEISPNFQDSGDFFLARLDARVEAD